jgi:hypothetical protein
MDKLEYYRQCIENLLLESGENPPVNGEAEELVQMGISKKDIVLGVQPPYVREDTGFGVA